MYDSKPFYGFSPAASSVSYNNSLTQSLLSRGLVRSPYIIRLADLLQGLTGLINSCYTQHMVCYSERISIKIIKGKGHMGAKSKRKQVQASKYFFSQWYFTGAHLNLPSVMCDNGAKYYQPGSCSPELQCPEFYWRQSYMRVALM